MSDPKKPTIGIQDGAKGDEAAERVKKKILEAIEDEIADVEGQQGPYDPQRYLAVGVYANYASYTSEL